MDFDTQYKEEEADLGDLNIYDFESFYRGPVRAPGMPLSEDISTAITSLKKEREEAANAAEAADAAESVDGDGGAPAEEGAQAEDKDAIVVPEEPDEVWPDAPLRQEGEEVPRIVGKHQDIIVVGPPLSGVTTMATHLARKLQLKVATFDAILTEIAKTSGISALPPSVPWQDERSGGCGAN